MRYSHRLMICQVCDLDKKITASKEAVIFGGGWVTKVEPLYPNHTYNVYIIRPKVRISSTQSVVYHHCERKYSLWLMIYTFGGDIPTLSDDIPLLSQWIKQNLTLFG